MAETKNALNDKRTDILITSLTEYTVSLREIASAMQMYGEFQHYIWPYSILDRIDSRENLGKGDFDYSQF